MANELITTPAFEIFRAGTFTSSDGRVVTITVDDLEQIAQSYQPDVAAAPLVVGHPELDDPAYGWVKRLFVQGLALMAEARDVVVEFATMVNQKRFPNRSASIYLEATPGNPFPGKKYLKHVGFLGAAAPAIPGLKPVQFSADDKAVCFNFPIIDNGVSTMEKDEMEQKQRELAAREAEIAAREAQVKAQEEKAARNAAVSFAAKLADEGKLLPTEVAGITELLIQLPNNQPLNFSAGGTQVSKAPVELIKEFLNGLPNRINYAEKSADAVTEKAVQFSAPAGIQVDNSQAELYQRATAYQAQHPGMDWISAVQAVGS